jgi:trigger factor
MNIETRELSRPIKVTIVEEPKRVKELKEKVYDEIKGNLQMNGFRKGNIPRDIAEKHFGKEKLYRKVIDEIFDEAVKKTDIVSSKNFKVFGDLSDTSSLKLEFIAEVQPTIDLCEFDKVKVVIEKNIKVTDEEIDEEIKKAVEQNVTYKNIERKELRNLDFVIIDFEGILEGETKPFKNGNSKDFKMQINLEKKSFVDNFEEQLIGMVIDEERHVNVTFPKDYRDKTKAGKKATFKVVLKALQEKVLPDINDDFAKKLGYQTLDEYKIQLEKNIFTLKTNESTNKLKKDVMKQLIEKSKYSPIPIDMIDNEVDREWRSLLQRMGQSEDEFLKQNPNYKEYFYNNNVESSEDLIKTTLVLKAISKSFDIRVTKDEVKQYTLKISNALKYDEEKQKRILAELEKPNTYNFQEKAALNEKVIDFLIASFNK